MAAALVAVVVGVLGGAGAAEAASPNVVFADANLKACVAQALGVPGPEVTVAELQTLTDLACRERDITSVAGLGQASSLDSLDLAHNELTDLGSLAGLGQLATLDVSFNRLQDVSALRALGRLTVAEASFNSIGTLGDLSTLNNLDRLSLGHNSITSAASFAGGAVLREVDLSYNLLADASFASRLAAVQTLNLSNNQLTSAVPYGRFSGTVNLTNQLVQLPPVAVDTVETLPVVRDLNLDPIGLVPIADSQAYGYQTPTGFIWRSNGVGQLAWSDTRGTSFGGTVTFSGRFVQPVTRGTLTAPTPTIAGSAVYLQKLTAVPGAWGPAPVALSYQWRRNGEDVAGATASTFTLKSADLGARMSVVVTGTKASYATASKESAQTAAVAAAPLTATPTPTVTGTPKVAQTLTAAAGVWGPSPVSLAYQWKRGGVAIAGATASTYTPVDADSGARITVTVTGSRIGYTSVSKTSAATATVTGGVISPVTPKIAGALSAGTVLTAVPGEWTPSPVTYTYRWNRDGVAISGATAVTYAVKSADLGTKITVTVTGSRAGFASVSRTSAPAAAPK